MDQYLILYATKIAVRGREGSAIYDLGRNRLITIPNTFYDIISMLEEHPYPEIAELYAGQQEVFESYIRFLLEEELAFFTKEPERYPRVDTEYHVPQDLSIAGWEYSPDIDPGLVASELDRCNCKYLELVLPPQYSSVTHLVAVLDAFESSTCRSIGVCMEPGMPVSGEKLDRLFKRYQKMASITLCGADRNFTEYRDYCMVVYAKPGLAAFYSDYMLRNFLIVNIDYFCESQSANPYYNKRVYIDGAGDIFNDRYQTEVFGNIKEGRLLETVRMESLQRLWKEIPPQLEGSAFRYCLYNPTADFTIEDFVNCKSVYQFGKGDLVHN